GAQPPAMNFWPQSPEFFTQEGHDAEDNLPAMFLAHQDDTMGLAFLQPLFNISPSKDFIRCLPLQLSMYILGFLDQKSLSACAAVNTCWAFLAEEVKRERVCQRIIQEKILYLQGLSPRGAVPNYAKKVKVTIPQLNKEGDVIEVKGHSGRSATKEQKDILQAVYHNLQTDKIELEERNVFCGSYNIRVLTDQPDPRRVIHYGGGNLVAIGSADRKVRFLEMSTMKEVPPLLSGHAGSIKALFLHEKKGFVLSTSFDLSIRCWNIHSGACTKVFTGHCGTITCLDFHEDQFVSGARDGMVKVWSLASGKCLRTLKHNSWLWVVKMDGAHVASGCERGLVKVWCAETGALIKTLEGHQGPVRCLSFDQWHLVTGSIDGYVLGWSMLGKLKRCLIAFRHPREVLSLEFLYLRVVSGCADGKIRVFNFLTGTCLKVLMANSRGDPISSFYVAENRLVINSPSSLLLFQFEEVRWDYTLPADRKMVGKKKQRKGTSGRASVPVQRPKPPKQSHPLTLETPGTYQFNVILLESTAGHKQAVKNLEVSHTASQSCESLTPNVVFSLLETDGSSEKDLSVYTPAHLNGDLQYKKERSLSCRMSRNKLFLMVNSLQRPCKTAHFCSREAWEDHQCPPVKLQLFKTPLQHKRDQRLQLQRVRPHSDSLTMRRISTPFETKVLQLKLKNSLHGASVNSSIPAPSVVRPKSCGFPPDKKAQGGHSKVIPLPEDRVPLLNPFAASSDWMRTTQVGTAQTKNDVVSSRISPFCPHAVGSSSSDSRFRLLTGKQKAEYEAAAVAQDEEHQTQLTEDQQRASKKAWLRKVKGLPVDAFTGEGKIPAPELGSNTFI
ncbi:FBW10 protein, partial [Turnix velox]|nr:FBW10 protein [Turnix velox]